MKNELVENLVFIGCESNNHIKFEAGGGFIEGVFISATADYTSFLSVIINRYEQSPAQSFNNQTTLTGAEKILGNSSAKDDVIFRLDVLETGDTWYSKASMNSDGLNHITYENIELPGGIQGLIIGFEDIYGGGDLDFNDNVVLFTNVSAVDLIL